MRFKSQGVAMVFALFGAVVFGMVVASGLRFGPEKAVAIEGNGQQKSATAAEIGLPDFADLAERVLPAVALVHSTTIEPAGDRSRDAFPFPQFFRDPRTPRSDDNEPFRSDGAGSGFIVDPEGYLITNYHVVEGATAVEVRLGEREYTAEVKGTDPSTDLALLKIKPSGPLPYLELGDSDRLRVGEWVMAIGNPLSLESSVSVGVVSAKGRQIGITERSFENFIQTDAAINRGNSGGPLVNLRGEVVGIATAMNFGAENIGFAVPSNTLRGILDQLRSDGRVKRGYLGVDIQDLDQDTAEAFGLEGTAGALVVRVREGSPADKAGLHHADVILRVDDHAVGKTRDLIDYVAAKKPGTTVNVLVLRDGKRVERRVELEDRSDSTGSEPAAEPEEEGAAEWLGLEYQDLTAALRRSLGVPSSVAGVLVTGVAVDSPLYEEGVERGNLIVEVNGAVVASAEEFERALALAPAGRPLRFYIQRVLRDGSMQPFFAVVRKP